MTHRPHGRNSSTHTRKEMQQTWNKFIDDYIALGTDPRTRAEIEKAAKISSGNGAYIGRACNGSNCHKVEDEKRFDHCPKCKIVSLIFYDLVFKTSRWHPLSYPRLFIVQESVKSQTGRLIKRPVGPKINGSRHCHLRQQFRTTSEVRYLRCRAYSTLLGYLHRNSQSLSPRRDRFSANTLMIITR